MKVALLYPPLPFLDDPHAQPPLGLMYLASMLKKHGHEPVFHDWSDEKTWRNRIDEFDEDVVGCYCAYPHFNFVKLLYSELRKKDIPLIVGGPDPSSRPEEYRDRCSVAVKGEGENAILMAVDWVLGKLDEPWKYFDLPYNDIDSLPFPSRMFKGFDIHDFRQELNGKKMTTVMFSRGCPYLCSFCDSASIWGRKTRRRSISSCVREIKEIEEFGFGAFFPEDDTFNSDNGWVLTFCDSIKHFGMSWRCLTRAHSLTEKVLIAMKESGCERLSIGVESGSDKILKNVHKGETSRQQLEGIRLAKKAGIDVQIFIMIGLPGEDWTTIEETKRFIEEARPEWFDLNFLRIFPGSGIYKERYNLDIQVLDTVPESSFYKGGISQVRTKLLSREDLERAYNEVYDFARSIGCKHTVNRRISEEKCEDIRRALS